jgi:hypothetical protein
MLVIYYPIPEMHKHMITRDKRVRWKNGKVDNKRYFHNLKGRVVLDPIVLDSTKEWTVHPRDSCYEVNRDFHVRLIRTQNRISVFICTADMEFDIEWLYECVFIPKKDRVFAEEIQSLTDRYPDIDFTEVWKLSPLRRSDLFCIRFPDVVEYWADDPKLLYDVSYASNKVFKWRCLDDPDHVMYYNSVYARTGMKESCPICSRTTENRRLRCSDNADIGRELEVWFAEQINKLPGVRSARSIGHESNSVDDIEVELLDNSIRSIQSKTLSVSLANSDSKHSIQMRTGQYPPDMLIIGSNRLKNKFFIAFARDIEPATSATQQVCICFSRGSELYNEFKFTDINLFLTRLTELLPQTILTKDIPNRYTPKNFMEVEMKTRLAIKCTEYGLSYKSHTDNSSITDAVVNNYTVQLKAINRMKSRKYVASIHRCRDGVDNQKYTLQDKVDFLIIEIKDFPGQFYIIPWDALLELGYIVTATTAGKDKLMLYPPGSTEKRRIRIIS